MNTFRHSGKFAGLFLQTKNIDITYMSSSELISWACKRPRKPNIMALILTNSILINHRAPGILNLKLLIDFKISSKSKTEPNQT